MCGIAGWVDWDEDLTRKNQILLSITNHLAHRGPDALATWSSPHAAFGHRRLVVVDPEGGEQPMTRSQGNRTYTITYNGELYNTLEIRRELEARGHHLLTRNSDTEVLLLAYMEWGKACLDRLNGIFAFAIWDEAEQRLFMARDRLGVKPLFYFHQGSMLLFGSELKALLAHPRVSPALDHEGLAEVLVMAPSRTPGHGVFHNIRELRPGYCLEYTRNGISTSKYWSLVSKPHLDDLQTTTRRVRELLEESVRRQLVSDVPIGTLLSGGLDSSGITALAARVFKEEGKGNLPTFSVDYRGNDEYFRSNRFQPDADIPWISMVSGYVESEHHHVTLDNLELAAALIPALRASDLPGMADIDSSLYLFCREIKKVVTVGLSGECADEILGGYPWFNWEGTSLSSFPWIRMNQKRWSLISPEIRDLINPEEYLADRYQEALSEVPSFTGLSPDEASMRKLFYLNITRFMPTLLDRKDRMSMASGLEIRVPFADHHLVEYVWNVPWTIKNCDGIPKGILRRALQGILSDEVLNRRKSPYPKTHNPLYFNTVRQQAIEILNDPSSPVLTLIDGKAVRQLVDTGQPFFSLPWFGQLMGDPQYLAHLIQINSWLRDYHVSLK